ncbi:MAG: hypothetical protein ACTSPX_03140 [Candidatus Thorarchaeota archaeon]
MSRMYEGVKTWNPYVGCRFNCVYCRPSFQRQAKRRRKWCEKCYNYEPHFHPERLSRLPGGKIVFACDMGDIAFAEKEWLDRIAAVMKEHGGKTFYLQSKEPRVFYRIDDLPENVIVGTTIETNKITFDTPSEYEFYREISQAPLPYKRYVTMKHLDHPRKYVTVEPILDFDVDVVVGWVKNIAPEFVYVGYDNHNCRLPEPPLEKTLKLIRELEKFTEVRIKTIRRAWWEAGADAD